MSEVLFYVGLHIVINIINICKYRYVCVCVYVCPCVYAWLGVSIIVIRRLNSWMWSVVYSKYAVQSTSSLDPILRLRLPLQYLLLHPPCSLPSPPLTQHLSVSLPLSLCLCLCLCFSCSIAAQSRNTRTFSQALKAALFNAGLVNLVSLLYIIS